MTCNRSTQSAQGASGARLFTAARVPSRLCRRLRWALLLAAALPAGPAAAELTVCEPGVEAAQARFAAALIGRLSKATKSENIVVAPASLAGAFGTLSLGADAPMGKALILSLGFKPDAACTPRDLFGVLADAADGLAKGAAGSVRMADRLILDPATKPYPLLLEGLTARGREIAVDDLSRPDAVARANDWVKDRTGGLIPAILPGPLERPALTVLDALHFKASWARRFDPALTKPHPFQGADGKGFEVMLMHVGEGRYLFRRNDEFVAVDLPFAGDRVSLTLVTTTGKAAAVAGFAKAAPFLDGTGYAPLIGTVALPRLRLSASGNLLPALPDLEKAGRGANALGGFAPNVRLSQSLQRVEMSADENGAEAAAATAVTTSRSFEGRPIAFVLDKPFLFALRDRATGLILVAGYVGRPVAAEPAREEVAKPEAAKPQPFKVQPTQPDVGKPDGSPPAEAPPAEVKPAGGRADADAPAGGKPDAGKAASGTRGDAAPTPRGEGR